MTRSEIYDRLKKILVDSFELDADEIRLDAHLIDDLDLDSIDAIDLAVGLEEELSLEVDEESLKSIRRVSDIVDLIHDRLEAA